MCSGAAVLLAPAVVSDLMDADLLADSGTSLPWPRSISASRNLAMISWDGCRAHRLPAPSAIRWVALTGRQAVPEAVDQSTVVRTLDTPENRFVRYLVELVAELAGNAEWLFRHSVEEGSATDAKLIADAQRLRQQLREWLASDFLAKVGEMTFFPASSQVLQRRSGYRELLVHYLALILTGAIR